METSLSYRLNLEEIIYLSASSKNPVKTIFGLKNRQARQEAGQMTWDGVRQRLLGKRILWDNEGRLTLYSEILGHIIHAVSRPQALIAVKPRQAGQAGQAAGTPGGPVMTRLYVRGGFAAAVDDDPHSEDYYTLRACVGHSAARAVLEDSFYFGDYPGDYPKTPGDSLSVTLNITEIQEFVNEAVDGSETGFCVKCAAKGIQRNLALDLHGAISGKRLLTSYAVYAFDPEYNGGMRKSQESFLYGGAERLWKIDMTTAGAEISLTSREAVNGDMSVMSRLMNFV
jgi:hypothetical protein